MPAGRPKKPTALKKVDGTFRKDRDGKATEVQHITSTVEVPKSLTDDKAREMWGYLVNRFTESRMLTELDLPLLELMCIEWQRYLKYESAIELQGEVITYLNTSENEVTKINPYMSLRDKALTRFTELAYRFGMTPSDRSKVTQIGKEETSDGFDDL